MTYKIVNVNISDDKSQIVITFNCKTISNISIKHLLTKCPVNNDSFVIHHRDIIDRKTKLEISIVVAETACEPRCVIKRLPIHLSCTFHFINKINHIVLCKGTATPRELFAITQYRENNHTIRWARCANLSDTSRTLSLIFNFVK